MFSVEFTKSNTEIDKQGKRTKIISRKISFYKLYCQKMSKKIDEHPDVR